jgi:transposase-like protein
MRKKCEKCGFTPCKKNWSRKGLQRYKCWSCWHVWENKRREANYDRLYEEYTVGKQTYAQLAERYAVHIITIKRHIEIAEVNKKK